MKVYLSLLVLFCVFLGVCCQQGKILTLSNSEKLDIINLHNELRAQVNAANMPNLVYNNRLELWTNWTQNCIFEHLSNANRTNVAGYSYVGENLALSSVNSPIKTFAGIWGTEKQQYVYSPITISNFAATAHYTQQIWANSLAIGCVRVNCTGVKNATGNFLLACNYGPGGNYQNQYPYVRSNNSNTPLLSGSPGGTPLLSPGVSGTARISISPTPSLSVSNSRAAASPAASTTSTSTATATSTATSTASGSFVPSSAPVTSIPPSSSPSITPSTTRTASTTRSLSNSISTSNSKSISTTNTATAAPSSTPSPSPNTCVPNSCGANSCGTIPNGCDGTSINCGDCTNGTCINNRCQACTLRRTCANKQCGIVYDSNCQYTQNCGMCGSGQTCENNQCVSPPVCPSTCSSLNYQCGTVVPENCTTQIYCGSCAAGQTCYIGRCVSTSCTSTCPPNAVCASNGTCLCITGYNNKQDGNGCTPALTIPFGFTEITTNNSFVEPENWVLTTEATTGVPQIDLVNSSTPVAGPVYRLSWDNAAQFSSLSKTTFATDVEFNAGVSIGLGLRLGQGAGRETDGIQWSFNIISGNAVSVEWQAVFNNVLYSLRNNMYDPNTQASWSGPNNGRGTFHNVKLEVSSTSIDGKTYQVSRIFVDGAPLDQPETVRPYDQIGGAYLYTVGLSSSFRNLALYTASTVYVSVQNCISAAALSSMINGALNVTVQNITLRNTSDSTGRCAQQSGNFTSSRRFLRQVAAEPLGTDFAVVFASDSIVSQSMVSKFSQLALSWNPVFAETGGVLSVEYAPITENSAELGVVNPIDLDLLVGGVPVAPVVAPVAPATTGLTGAATAGIVVGSVVGGVAIFALLVLAAVVAAMVYKSRKAASKQIDETRVNDVEAPVVEMKETSVQDEREQSVEPSQESLRVKKPKGSGPNVFDLNPNRHGSITSRLEGRASVTHLSYSKD